MTNRRVEGGCLEDNFIGWVVTVDMLNLHYNASLLPFSKSFDVFCFCVGDVVISDTVFWLFFSV